MEISLLSEKIKNSIEIKKINDDEYLIQPQLFFPDQSPYQLFLMQDKKGNKILTDKKRTMKYMDEFYELNSSDVKDSINSILDIYNISLYKDALVYKLKPTDDIAVVFYEFVSCLSQLVNMYIFFDKPQDDE